MCLNINIVLIFSYCPAILGIYNLFYKTRTKKLHLLLPFTIILNKINTYKREIKTFHYENEKFFKYRQLTYIYHAKTDFN